MLDYLIVFGFLFLLGIFILRDRKNLEFKYGFVIKKWHEKIELLENFVKKHKKLLKILGIVSVAIGLIASLISFGFLIYFPLQKKGGVSLVLPSAGGFKYPGPVLSVDLIYWLPSIFILLIAHEGMHALFARSVKVKVKNYGIFLFLFFPLGAFVNPVEKQIKKLRLIDKLKIFSAGSFGNFLVAALIFFLINFFLFLFSISVEAKGIKFEVINGTPADQVNLSGIIIRIENKSIATIKDLQEFMETTQPGQKVEIETTEGIYELTLVKNPDNNQTGFIGIKNLEPYLVFKNGKEVPRFLLEIFGKVVLLFQWIFVINLGIGLANLLPLKPLDGGLIWEEIMIRFFKKKGIIISNFLNYLTLTLLLLNFYLSATNSLF
jgi:membrane-associated protease RseP (regulator of RpoE activity)